MQTTNFNMGDVSYDFNVYANATSGVVMVMASSGLDPKALRQLRRSFLLRRVLG